MQEHFVLNKYDFLYLLPWYQGFERARAIIPRKTRVLTVKECQCWDLTDVKRAKLEQTIVLTKCKNKSSKNSSCREHDGWLYLDDGWRLLAFLELTWAGGQRCLFNTAATARLPPCLQRSCLPGAREISGKAVCAVGIKYLWGWCC